MIVKDTIRGKEFITQNKFSRYLISDNDRKLDMFLRIKHRMAKFLHMEKSLSKTYWYDMMDFNNNEIADSSFNSHIREQIILDKDDLHLEEVICYDLLPKEFIPKYASRYIKFRGKYLNKKNIFTHHFSQVQESFEKIIHSNNPCCWFNVDMFKINEHSRLYGTFSALQLEFIGLTESFYMVKYRLKVCDEINDILNEILKSQIYRRPQCQSCDKWWKNKSLASCITFDVCEQAKMFTIRDYILELKALFFNEIKKELLTIFFSWKNIIPSIEIYSSKTLNCNKDKILKLISVNACNNNETSNDRKLYYVHKENDLLFMNKTNNGQIVADSELFVRDAAGFCEMDKYEEVLKNVLAENVLLNCILRNSEDILNTSQLKIDFNVYKKSKINSIIKTKLKIDKSLYYYKRFVKELSEIDDDILDMKISEYNDLFAVQKEPDRLFAQISFECRYKGLYNWAKKQGKHYNRIYTYFEDNAKIIESRYNYRIVKWTFIVGFLTLAMTLFFNLFGKIS